MIEKIKHIFFDFDGVIAESVSAKTEAFRELYLPYGEEIATKVVDHHIHHGGVSRFEKFKVYHSTFLNKDITEEQVQELARQFSNLVLEKVINSDEVKGANEFIKKYSDKLNLWIITGTPTPEIKIIAKARKLDSYFIELYGSPENKKHWTEFIIHKHQLKRDEIIFLGDATTDQDAALFSKTHFALRVHEENIEVFKDYAGWRFSDFTELDKLLKPYLL